MNLPESEMSLPVMTWLDGLGYVPYAEVPNYDTCIDIVAMREPGPDLIAVEMKTGLTKQVIRQAYVAQLVAERVYCAVLSKPKDAGLAKCADLGIGVLRIVEGVVEVLGESASKKAISPGAAERVVEQLRGRVPGGVAGRPNLKGDGPAQDCGRRVQAWRAEHPTATWREIYEHVENHYSSMVSMRGALTSRGLA